MNGPFERARDQVLARAGALSTTSRRALPAKLRTELARLEMDLTRQRQTVDDVRIAEQLLTQYEQCLAAALEWDEQRQAQRALRTRRWRGARWVTGFALVVLAPVLPWSIPTVADRHEYFSWQCATDDACTEAGRCGAPWGAALFGAADFEPWRDCVDPGCAQACARFGRCRTAFGTCIAVSEADCLTSDACRQDGRCTLLEGGCTIATAADCASSRGCVEEGRCTMGPHTCIAKTDSDCLSAECCTRHGRCRPNDERCVLGDPLPRPCEALCQQSGRCELQEGRCAATSDTDCAFSEDCDRWGRCAAEHGRCVANRSVYCRQSLACTQMGRCHARDGECYRRAGE